ncbi:MAG: hypothetical protein ACFFD1_06480 [Candidatus Thorarchaeota archaeon]
MKMSFFTIINNKSSFFENHTLLSLFIIGIVGLSLRLYFFDFDIPVNSDALGFFFYAADTSFLGSLPPNYSPANNGWPAFLSILFSLFKFEDTISYMNLQRLASVIISIITIIPIFYLCNRFFEKKYCIIGVCIFAFEPRLIQNSLIGISDPLYIFLLTTSLAFFLSTSKKIIYFSFVLSALATLVRSEGLFLFLALSVVFFIRYRKDKLVFPKYLLVLTIFVLILLPMALYKIEATGTDNLIMRISSSASNFSDASLIDNQKSSVSILTGLENFPKYLVWDLIPIFIFFVPFGFILVFRHLNYQSLTIISSLISMSFPAFYAYSIPLPETRYFYFLYPLFCVLSLYPIRRLINKLDKQNIALLLIISIFIISTIFLGFKMDTSHERDAFLIAKHISALATGVNQYLPESTYLETVDIPSKWSDFKNYFLGERIPNTSIRTTFEHNTILFSLEQFDSLEKFISLNHDKGLSHLIVDDKSTRPDFLSDVFFHEKKYPFLIKEFDSDEQNFIYHVKIFKIDYNKFEIND